jgi:hypothetical protein
MNNGFIILAILLLLLVILAVSYYVSLNVVVEKFVDTSYLYPININRDNIYIPIIAKKATFNDLYVATVEQYEESTINDSILAIYSSFRNDNASPKPYIFDYINTVRTAKIPPILKLVPSTIPAKDYLFIDLPEESVDKQLTKVSITYDTTKQSAISGSNIFNIGTVNFKNPNPFASAQLISMNIQTSQLTSNTITYDYTPINNSSALFCNLALVTVGKIKLPIYITSIQLYFKSLTPNVVQTNTDIIGDKINILSDNPAEQISVNLPTIVTDNTASSSPPKPPDVCNTIENKYSKLLKLKIPYVIYDASKVNGSVLADQLNRPIRNANISGSYEKKTEGNITYISGTTGTSIQFPLGCIPRSDFTICAITKYTNPTGNRNQILSTSEGVAIGHDGAAGIITFDGSNKSNTPPTSSFNSDWVITCYKLDGKKIEKTLIINDIQLGNNFIGPYDPVCIGAPQGSSTFRYPREFTTKYDDLVSDDYCDYQINLFLNNNPNASNSDFGLAYLMIWHTRLLDNELVIVSKILNNYINNNIKNVVLSIQSPITIYDGSTEDKAAISAMAIKTATNDITQTNGFYWIKPTGTAIARKVFCIMDNNCDGGGWMLAMKAKPGSTTFNYGSDYWIKNNVLLPATDIAFEGSTPYMDTTLDAKYDIYNSYLVTDCLAIFDGREFNLSPAANGQCGTNDSDVYTDPGYKQYGWRWIKKNFNNNTPITLLNYFANNNRHFAYTCRNTQDKPGLDTFMKNISGAIYVDYNYFLNYIIGNRSRLGKEIPPYNSLIWSTQSEFLSYGFNIYIENWAHRVRWGGTFNENGGSLPTTNDVSGGIGMEQRSYSAGDAIGCCQNTTGLNKSLSFKWFIR